MGPILLNLLIFIVAITVLLKGSDWFIDSAEAIGRSIGISPFVIGITIVAFGTSLPELATSVASVFKGQSEIVIGNVIGSNIANIGLVIGLVALVVRKIVLENNIWNIDMSFLWGSAFLLGFAIYDQVFSIFEAIVFLVGIVIFLVYSLKNDAGNDGEEAPKTTAKEYLLLILGGVAIWAGATYTVEAICNLSIHAGISPEVIALSAVAIGTSLPEVAVSINAARKGKTSIAVGNVVGSNIFNTFVVMGVSGLVGPLNIPADIIAFSLPFMLAMTILFGVMTNAQRISIWEGLLLLLLYLYYMAKLFGA